jgi:hypothetical protein
MTSGTLRAASSNACRCACDVDEHVHGTACLLLIDESGVSLDESRFLQSTHSSQGRGFGQADAFSQLTVGDAAVELQGTDDGPIVAIQFHAVAFWPESAVSCLELLTILIFCHYLASWDQFLQFSSARLT